METILVRVPRHLNDKLAIYCKKEGFIKERILAKALEAGLKAIGCHD